MSSQPTILTRSSNAMVGQFPELSLMDEPLDYHGTQVFRALKRLPVEV